MTMDCSTCTDLVLDALYGELDEPIRARVEEHLAQCSECRAEYAELRQIVESVPKDRELGLDDARRETVLRAAVAAHEIHAPVVTLRPKAWVPLSLAAVLCAGFVAYMVGFNPLRSEQALPPRSAADAEQMAASYSAEIAEEAAEQMAVAMEPPVEMAAAEGTSDDAEVAAEELAMLMARAPEPTVEAAPPAASRSAQRSAEPARDAARSSSVTSSAVSNSSASAPASSLGAERSAPAPASVATSGGARGAAIGNAAAIQARERVDVARMETADSAIIAPDKLADAVDQARTLEQGSASTAQKISAYQRVVSAHQDALRQGASAQEHASAIEDAYFRVGALHAESGAATDAARALSVYLERYPSGRHASAARALLEKMNAR